MILFYQKEKKYNYFSKDFYDKMFTILIIISLTFGLLMVEFYKNIAIDPIYKKIKDFENSYIKSFLYIFFIENEVSKIKNFWKINRKNQLIVKASYHNNNNNKKEIPDISIIITVYNQVNCFYRALRSIQNQSLQNLEIIIVDDCSTDNSLEIFQKYQEKIIE